MPEDLPIYSDSMLRTRLQFAGLEPLKDRDVNTAWLKSDKNLERVEGAANIGQARQMVNELTKAGLLQMHAIVFKERAGAGELRHGAIKPRYRGQDCPAPQFIERSLDNFFKWLTAESMAEIHPIERAALVLTRVADIWPFEFGNLTMSIVAANFVLRDASFAPFYVRREHAKEFETVIAQAMTIETQPLVNAIYNTIKREMEALASG